MTSWKVFVAQLLTIIAGKSQTRKWALDKGGGLADAHMCGTVDNNTTSHHAQIGARGTVTFGPCPIVASPRRLDFRLQLLDLPLVGLLLLLLLLLLCSQACNNRHP